MVLTEAAHDDAVARDRAIRLGANWVMGMQSKDGGFAAFDTDNIRIGSIRRRSRTSKPRPIRPVPI